jgi:hypothetical protein
MALFWPREAAVERIRLLVIIFLRRKLSSACVQKVPF